MTVKPAKRNLLKLTIWMLAILLLLSIAALICLRVFGQKYGNRASATVPDNIVTSDAVKQTGWQIPATAAPRLGKQSRTPAAPLYINNSMFLPTIHAAQSGAQTSDVTIRLHKQNPEDNVPFHVPNMFPGDAETKNFCVEVSYRNTLTVHFRAAVRPGYEKLAEVLMCRVVLNDTQTLYDGPMKDMPQSLDHTLVSAEGTTEALAYTITAYLDTSVGNEYQNKTLIADFYWWVGSQGGSNVPGDGEQPGQPGQPGDQPGEDDDREDLIDPPYTGDDNSMLLWIVILSVSAAAVVLLIAAWKKEARNERK